ncbi:MAG: helicase-related protein [Planctomycetota bacterium]
MGTEGTDLIDVVGRGRFNRDRRARFLIPIDRPKAVRPASLSLGKDDGPENASWLRAFLLAFEIGHTFGPDTLHAIAHGRISLEPFQLAPALRLLSLPRPRLLIADDVGLGKTVETGIALLEMERRGKASRILVVCPPTLTGIWRDVLASKFEIHAEIFDSESVRKHRRSLPAHLNPWQVVPRVITSLDWAKQPHVLRALSPVRWDAVVLDECHHFALRGHPPSRRARLARCLADRTDILLLLSATPHDGSPTAFGSLLGLLDSALVDGSGSPSSGRATQHMIRRLKTGVRLASGARFLERRVSSLPVALSETERFLHRAVTVYANRLLDEHGDPGVTFIASILKKRLLSSPLALARSLEARKERLEQNTPFHPDQGTRTGVPSDLLFGDLGAAPRGDADRREETEEIERLLGIVRPLLEKPDGKIMAVRNLVDKEIRDSGGKAVLFTEYRDTLEWIQRWFSHLDPLPFHGGLDSSERREVLQSFRQSEDHPLLIATDAAGEGIDLQERCSLLIHFELPWNPNRMEQRNGRIDRYGSSKPPRIFHTVVEGSLESALLDLLHRKVDRIRRELGSASEVLASFGNFDPEPFILQARGAPNDSKREFEDLVDAQVRTRFETWKKAGSDSILAPRVFGREEEEEVLEVLRRSRGFPPEYPECRRLLEGSFSLLGGRIEETGEPSIVRLHVPPPLQGADLPPRIDRATFERETALRPEARETDFITPSHPLIRECVHAMKSRLFDSCFPARVCAVKGSEDGFLFVFQRRFLDGRGECVEESLESVFVPRTGPVSSDAESDRERLWSAGEGPSVTRPPWVAAQWSSCLKSAREEERRRRVLRAEALGLWAAERAGLRMESLARLRSAKLARLEECAKLESSAPVDLFTALREEEEAHRLAYERDRTETRLQEDLLGIDASSWIDPEAPSELLGAWVTVWDEDRNPLKSLGGGGTPC